MSGNPVIHFLLDSWLICKVMKRIVFILLLGSIACHNIGFDDDPADNPMNNFQIYWDEFDKHYSFFEYKGIDWDSVYNDNINRVDESNLFPVLSQITLAFEDGHVGLFAEEQIISFDYTHVGDDDVTLKMRVQDHRTYRAHNDLLGRDQIAVTDLLDATLWDGGAVADVPTTTE